MSTIPKMFLDRVLATPDRRAFSAHEGGAWKDFTWKDFHDEARAFGLGLTDLGLARRDVVAILGGTRREWAVSDIGAIGAGGVTVGLYPTLQPDGVGSMRYVLEHSEAKVLIVENRATFNAKIAPILAKLPRLAHIVLWDASEADAAKDGATPAGSTALDPRILSYDAVLERGRAVHARDASAWSRACDAARPGDLALLVYTSGTTGEPKGAMLSHGNVVAIEESMAKVLPLEEGGGTMVSFLPMAHVAERCVGHYGRIKEGRATHFARSQERLLEDIATAKPSRFGSVPRIFEKVHAKVIGQVESLGGVRGLIARRILAAGMEAHYAKKEGRPTGFVTRRLARAFDAKIAAPLRARFGGKCDAFVTGAAPVAVPILDFFEACGFKTYELYGLTETTGLLTANQPDAYRYGTVGKPLPGVEIRLEGDGEILARGANIFLGYFKEPEATAACMKDGWFATGDIGAWDEDGFLKITDRKKNILITAGGKNITPSNIENEVKNDPLVSFCHLHADRRAFPTALVCLDPEQLKAFAKERGLEGSTAAELAENVVLRERVASAIERANQRFAQFERIKKFAILPREFSVDTGELTPTMKVKRKEVERAYKATLDALYASVTPP